MACEASCPKPSSPNEPLAEELAAAVEDAGDTLARGRRRVGEVPPGAVPAVGEDPDEQHAEAAADTRAPTIAPTGSSMPLRSMKKIASITTTAAIDPDHRRRPRLHERARRRDRHQAGEHAVHHHAGVGLAHPLHRVEHRRSTAPNAPAMAVFDRDDGEAQVGGRERRRRVEPEPAEQQDERRRAPPSGCCAPPGRAACRRARTCRCAVRARSRPRARRRRPSRGRRRSRRSRRSRSRARGCCRAGSASRRPRSTRRRSGSRARRRTGPSRRTPSTSTARPSPRSGSWPWCP